MKKSAFLVNTARGKIINENDLIEALEKKIVAGAALDVFESEPIGKNHPFTKMYDDQKNLNFARKKVYEDLCKKYGSIIQF